MTKQTLPLTLFYLAKLLANLAILAFLPILPVYLQGQQATSAQIGLFFSILAAGRLGAGLVGGWLADTYGPLRALFAGSLTGVLAFPMLLAFTGSWLWTLVGMSLLYFAGALTTPAQAAFVGTFVQEGRGKAFGLMNTVQAVAQTAAPALGGWLAAQAGFVALFCFSGASYTVAMLIRLALLRTVPATPKAAETPRQTFGQALRAFRLLLLAGELLTWVLIFDAFDDVARALTEVYQPLYLDAAGLSVAQIGLIGSLAAGAMLIGPTLAGWLVDRVGPKTPLTLASGLAGLAALAFVLMQTFMGFALAWSVVGLTAGLGMTALDTLISQTVPETQRGMAYGLLQTAQGLFALPVPLLGAWLYAAHPDAPFFLAGLASLMGAAVVWRKFPAGVSASPETLQPIP